MLKEIKHINLLKLETQNSNVSTFVFPKNTLEVSKLLKLCNKRKIEVVPIGGNTNRVKGTFQIDKTKSILMSLKHMNKIKTIDEDNLIMTVEAGVTLEKVQKKSLGKGFLFPVHVASHKECNIGGNIRFTNNSPDLCRKQKWRIGRVCIIQFKIFFLNNKNQEKYLP